MKAYLYILLAAVTWNLSSCQKPTSIKNAPLTDSVVSASILDYNIYFDAERFFIKTVESGLKLKNASEQALQMASSDSIRNLALALKECHTKDVAQIIALGDNLNVAIPAVMNAIDAQQVSDLKEEKNTDFDYRFIKMVIEDYERSIPLFEQAVSDANNSEIRNVASSVLPNLYAQLSKARIIERVYFRDRLISKL
ncbi:DUF4142 domain-containing protein [Sphingobacterium spiritivorum]|uniref:DUF4142 domain-containing protein n=1 Tax=Sphingobacterium spiritivorum TaxID=258 RepID=UPI001918390B|nr:DUF4142 domain-containing protein [Sphingobacterium spiritivorum]QQT27719.1 DUF4142 domain-containing protein [Sphingobacterium spiritivorum]